MEARDHSANASNLVRTFMLGLSPDDVQPDGIPACVVRDANCSTAVSTLSSTYNEFKHFKYGGRVPPGVQEFSESALLGESVVSTPAAHTCLETRPTQIPNHCFWHLAEEHAACFLRCVQLG